MAGEWQTLPFSEAISINPKVPLTRGATYPFVDMAAINSDSRCVCMSEEREFKGGGSRFQAGDTLLARITPCLENGKIARFCAPVGTVAHGSTEFIVIRGREEVSSTAYAYYLTKWEGVRGYAISQMTGTSGRQRVPTASLDHLEVPLPSLPEQNKIADILGSLDDKIELNRRMNRTLEAMARAIFKAWFGEFEPVKAKAAGATRFRGMPQAIFDQLPDRFTDTELGPVPEGWERRPLAEVTNYLKRGISPKYIEKGGVCVINQRCIRDHWVDAAQSRRHDEELKSVKGRELQPLDVLVNSTGVGTLGRVAQVLSLSEKTVVDSHVTVVRANPEELLPEILGCDLSFREREIEMLGHGSTGQTELSRTRLGELLVTKAPRRVQEAFASAIRPLNGKRVANWAESQILAAIRDTLLPKLISGELRVPVSEGGADGG